MTKRLVDVQPVDPRQLLYDKPAGLCGVFDGDVMLPPECFELTIGPNGDAVRLKAAPAGPVRFLVQF